MDIAPKTAEVESWLQQGAVIADTLMVRLQEDGWVQENCSEEAVNVFSKSAQHGKIYSISGTLPAAPDRVMTELFHNFEAVPKWNPNIIKCEILQKIDARTDITYKVGNSAWMVASRDFVTLRHYKIDSNGSHILAAASIKYAPKPPNQGNFTRGTNGMGGWVASPCPGEPSRSQFQWLLDVDLHLPWWIPKWMVEAPFRNAALETVVFLRQKLLEK